MTKREMTRQKFLEALQGLGKAQVTKTEIKQVCETLGISGASWFTKEETNKVSRGLYRVPAATVDTVNMQAQVIPMTKAMEKSTNKIVNVQTDLDSVDLIPKQYKNYFPFGDFEDIVSIVSSKKFFPVFVTGHSGNGKTMSIEQACAKAKRKFICISMTPETDEGDLLGNYVLINGNMEWINYRCKNHKKSKWCIMGN